MGTVTPIVTSDYQASVDEFVRASGTLNVVLPRGSETGARVVVQQTSPSGTVTLIGATTTTGVWVTLTGQGSTVTVESVGSDSWIPLADTNAQTQSGSMVSFLTTAAASATYGPLGSGMWTPRFVWGASPRSSLPMPWQVRQVMASGPTIGTISSTQTVTGKGWYALTGGGGSSATVDPNAPFAYLGAGNVTKTATVTPYWNYVSMKSLTNTNIESAPYTISFFFDGTTLELMVRNSAGFGWEIYIDGQLAQAAPVASSNAFIQGYIPITFATRAVRLIQVRTSQPFRGVTTAATDTIWPAPAWGPRCLIAGDSYTSGTGGTYAGISGYVRTFADIMNWPDTVMSGVGSTGWLSPGTQTKLGDRVQNDIINLSPDIVIITMGHNDLGYTAAQVQAEVTSVLTTIRAGLPNLKKLIVTGPLAQGAAIASYAAHQAAIFAGAAGLADATIDTVTAPWFTGTGKSGATTGDGNGDYYITTDGVHPTDAGHAYLGKRMAGAVQALMAA